MAKKKKNFEAEVEGQEVLEETATEEVETTEEVEVAPVVTNVVSRVFIDPDEKPAPDLKLDIPVAPDFQVGDKVKVVNVRGFTDISGPITEIRLDGFVIVASKKGNYAVAQVNLQKI